MEVSKRLDWHLVVSYSRVGEGGGGGGVNVYARPP